MNTLIKGPVSEQAINIFNHALLDRSAKVSSRWNLGRSSTYGGRLSLTVHFAGMLRAGRSTQNSARCYLLPGSDLYFGSAYICQLLERFGTWRNFSQLRLAPGPISQALPEGNCLGEGWSEGQLWRFFEDFSGKRDRESPWALLTALRP